MSSLSIHSLKLFGIRHIIKSFQASLDVGNETLIFESKPFVNLISTPTVYKEQSYCLIPTEYLLYYTKIGEKQGLHAGKWSKSTIEWCTIAHPDSILIACIIEYLYTFKNHSSLVPKLESLYQQWVKTILNRVQCSYIV